MSNWFIYKNNFFNRDHFKHIWIEKYIIPFENSFGFYLMGEFANSDEEVVLSENFKTEMECFIYAREILT